MAVQNNMGRSGELNTYSFGGDYTTTNTATQVGSDWLIGAADFSVHVFNTGAASATVNLDVSLDGTNWISDYTTARVIAPTSGTTAFNYAVGTGELLPYVRIRAKSTTNGSPTTVKVIGASSRR